MLARIAFTFCTLLLPILGFADSRDKECQEWTRQAVENPAVGCEAACSQAKHFDRYGYHAGLIAAQKDLAGLEKFVRYTARSSIIGAGSEEQACHLYACSFNGVISRLQKSYQMPAPRQKSESLDSWTTRQSRIPPSASQKPIVWQLRIRNNVL